MHNDIKTEQITLNDNKFYTSIFAESVDWEKVEIFNEEGYVAYVNIDKTTIPDEYEVYDIVDDGFENPRGIFKEARNPYCVLLIDKNHKDKIPVNETQCYWFSGPSTVKFSKEFYVIRNDGKMQRSRKVNYR